VPPRPPDGPQTGVTPEDPAAGEAPVAVPRPGPEPCAACGSPVATRHAAPGGPVWLCPACAAFDGLGCP